MSADITIIVPVYNEETALEAFFNALEPILNGLNRTYEYLFIDDGSTDNTLNILKQYRQKQKNVNIISFSRNFGQPTAIFCGIQNATGKCAIIIDADLQHPPQVIPEFIKKWDEGFQVVSIHGKRKDYNLLRRAISSIFYKIYNIVSRDKTQTSVSDFCLLDRKAIDAVKQYKGNSPYFKGLVKWIGLKSCLVTCDITQKRAHGKSKWKFFNRVSAAIDALVFSSSVPVRMFGYLGMFLLLIAFAYTVYIVTYSVVHSTDISLRGAALAIILFSNGIWLVSISVIGEYITYLIKETGNQPLYIVKEELTD